MGLQFEVPDFSGPEEEQQLVVAPRLLLALELERFAVVGITFRRDVVVLGLGLADRLRLPAGLLAQLVHDLLPGRRTEAGYVRRCQTHADGLLPFLAAPRRAAACAVVEHQRQQELSADAAVDGVADGPDVLALVAGVDLLPQQRPLLRQLQRRLIQHRQRPPPLLSPPPAAPPWGTRPAHKRHGGGQTSP